MKAGKEEETSRHFSGDKVRHAKGPVISKATDLKGKEKVIEISDDDNPPAPSTSRQSLVRPASKPRPVRGAHNSKSLEAAEKRQQEEQDLAIAIERSKEAIARSKSEVKTSPLSKMGSKGVAFGPQDPTTKPGFHNSDAYGSVDMNLPPKIAVKHDNRKVVNGKQVQHQKNRIFNAAWQGAVNQGASLNKVAKVAPRSSLDAMGRIPRQEGAARIDNPMNNATHGYDAPSKTKNNRRGSDPDSPPLEPPRQLHTDNRGKAKDFYSQPEEGRSPITFDRPPPPPPLLSLGVKGKAKEKEKKATPKAKSKGGRKGKEKQIDVIEISSGDEEDEDDIQDPDGEDAANSRYKGKGREDGRRRQSMNGAQSSPDPLNMAPFDLTGNVSQKREFYENGGASGSGGRGKNGGRGGEEVQTKLTERMKPRQAKKTAGTPLSTAKKEKTMGADSSDDDFRIGEPDKKKEKRKRVPMASVLVEMWSLNEEHFPLLHTQDGARYSLVAHSSPKPEFGLWRHPSGSEQTKVVTIRPLELASVLRTDFPGERNDENRTVPFLRLNIQPSTSAARALCTEIGMVPQQLSNELSVRFKLKRSDSDKGNLRELIAVLETDRPFGNVEKPGPEGAIDIDVQFNRNYKVALGGDSIGRSGPSTRQTGGQQRQTSLGDYSRKLHEGSSGSKEKRSSLPSSDKQDQKDNATNTDGIATRKSARKSGVLQDDIPQVKSTFDYSIPEHKVVLVYPPDQVGSVSVTHGDTKRLQDGEFLNDTLLEYGLKKILLDLGDRAQAVHMFNSFFYKKLSTKKSYDADVYKSVRKWTNKIKFFEKDFIIVPVNEHLHWYLAVIVNPGALLKPPVTTQKKAAPAPIRRSKRASLGAELHSGNVSAADADDERDAENKDAAAAEDAEEDAREAKIIERIQAEASMTQEGPPQDADGDVNMTDIVGSKEVINETPEPGGTTNDDTEMVQASSDNGESSEKAVEESLVPKPSSKSNSMPSIPIPPPTLISPSPVAPDDKSGTATLVHSGEPGSSQDVTIVEQQIDPSDLCYIFTFDSLGGTHKPVTKRLARYLVDEAQDKLQISVDHNYENSGDPYVANVIQSSVPVPIQNGFCDCGLYVLHFVEKFLNDRELRAKLLVHPIPKPSKTDSKHGDPLWDPQSAATRRKVFREQVTEASQEWATVHEPKLAGAQRKKKEERELKRKQAQEVNTTKIDGENGQAKGVEEIEAGSSIEVAELGGYSHSSALAASDGSPKDATMNETGFAFDRLPRGHSPAPEPIPPPNPDTVAQSGRRVDRSATPHQDDQQDVLLVGVDPPMLPSVKRGRRQKSPSLPPPLTPPNQDGQRKDSSSPEIQEPVPGPSNSEPPSKKRKPNSSTPRPTPPSNGPKLSTHTRFNTDITVSPKALSGAKLDAIFAGEADNEVGKSPWIEKEKSASPFADDEMEDAQQALQHGHGSPKQADESDDCYIVDNV